MIVPAASQLCIENRPEQRICPYAVVETVHKLADIGFIRLGSALDNRRGGKRRLHASSGSVRRLARRLPQRATHRHESPDIGRVPPKWTEKSALFLRLGAAENATMGANAQV